MGSHAGTLDGHFTGTAQLTYNTTPQQRRPVNNSEDVARQQKWARSEGGSRNLGTGRASAVTGMNKSVKAGSGSKTTGQRKALGGSSSSLSSQAHGAKKLAKAPSALSAVSGRRARFG